MIRQLGRFSLNTVKRGILTVGSTGFESSNSSYSNYTSGISVTSSVGQYNCRYWFYNNKWYQNLGSWYSDLYSLENLGPELEFTYSSGGSDVSVSGFASSFKGYNLDYGKQFFELGSVSGFEEFSKLQFSIYRIFSTTNQPLLYTYTYTHGSFPWSFNTGSLSFNVNGVLKIKSSLLHMSPYYLIIYALDDENNVLDSVEGYFLFRSLGSNIPTMVGSGDYQGSGDYTVQDQTNNTDDIIANLFTLSSGDIDDIYSDVVAYFPSGDRPDQIYDIIFGTLNSEPSDFVISWGNIPVMLTLNGGQTVFSGDLISGDSINFSKLCRENNTMMLIKFYLNLFVMIFFTIAYLSTLYKCLLIMLGLSTDFVGDLMEPEHRQIGFINDWRDK